MVEHAIIPNSRTAKYFGPGALTGGWCVLPAGRRQDLWFARGLWSARGNSPCHRTGCCAEPTDARQDRFALGHARQEAETFCDG
jgi:hypothetical protein